MYCWDVSSSYSEAVQKQQLQVNELKSIYISLLWLIKSFSLEQNQQKLKQELLKTKQKHLTCLSDVWGHNVCNDLTNTVKKKKKIWEVNHNNLLLSCLCSWFNGNHLKMGRNEQRKPIIPLPQFLMFIFASKNIYCFKKHLFLLFKILKLSQNVIQKF